MKLITITLLMLSLTLVECTTQKRNCGSNRQHRSRSKRVKKMAPGWSYIDKTNTKTFSY